MRIVFMGTPEFAVPCLDAITASGHELCGIFTRRDKPKGRGHCIACSPVKKWASEHDIRVLQPATLKDGREDAEIASLAPDVIVVTAYGCILPPSVLSIPQLGCVNVHASLLPKYRGSAPIQRCILNGETETGVTTMFLSEGLDTGDMILKAKTPIGENETAGELHDRLCLMGARLLAETLVLLEQGKAPREKQDDSLASWAPMLDKSISPVDWNASAADVHNRIRGLNPWPCASTLLNGNRLKILRSEKTAGVSREGTAKPGEIVRISPEGIEVCCGDGQAVRLLEIQQEGKRKMSVCDFVCGHKVKAGTVLGK